MSGTKCPQCGAFLVYEPGTTHLKCPSCASEFPIEQSDVEIREHDFERDISRIEEGSDLQEIFTVRCTGCGAEISLPPNVTAGVCPFCAGSIIADDSRSRKAIRPESLLPFEASAKQVNTLFKRWIKSLWFAPGDLKKLARTEGGLTGIYVPYWTYDADTSSDYVGERGEVYYEPEQVTVVRDGKTVTETRMVQKIRWYPAQGTVRLRFDDVMVIASKSLRTDYAQALEPWDLTHLVPYDQRFLSGFLCESYQIGPKDGFEIAKSRMESSIEDAIRADIGGDAQQIHSKRTAYDDITFKHLLLPVWTSSYRYRNKLFRFLVNARTGEVQGERPWSWIKIALAAAAVALAVYGFAVLSGQFQ